MSRHPEPPPAGGRRPYARPQLRRVSLVPDEAVLASCKNATTSGPWSSAAKCNGIPSVCSRDAS